MTHFSNKLPENKLCNGSHGPKKIKSKYFLPSRSYFDVQKIIAHAIAHQKTFMHNEKMRNKFHAPALPNPLPLAKKIKMELP